MTVELMTERPPYIEFRVLSEEDRAETIATGSYKTKDVDYVTIMPAGDRNTKIDRKVDEWLDQIAAKVRQGMANPQHLEHFRSSYRMWKENQELPLDGMPIKSWPGISPSQVQNILSANIRTVEDLALANEDALQRIGMGARALKEKAASWLATATDKGKVAEENAALKARVDDLTLKVNELVDINKELMMELSKDKPKRGRPPANHDDDIDLKVA
jgi:Helix-hairpin-helix domain